VAAAAASAVVMVVATVAWLAPPAASASAIRIDAGSWKTSVTAADGTSYARSSGFTGGRAGSVATTPVTGRLGDAVLRTGWIGMSAWSAAVPDGTYLVTLAMAETYWRAPGKRVFSATAEGQSFFTDLDIYAEAGRSTELDRSILVAVSDGRLDLGFVARVDLPAVAAITVEPAVAEESPSPTASVEPSPTDPAVTESPTSDPSESASSPEATSPSPTLPTPTVSSADPVLVAAGDLACDPKAAAFNGGTGTRTECRQQAVSDLVVSDTAMTAFAALGDDQYADGTLAAFQRSYAPSFGRVLDRTIPVVGNHEYQTRGAAGYFDYFGGRAGDRSTGYYSTDVGAWHVVVLNTNCGEIGGCGTGSKQEQWLRADLAAHPARCTVALTHHPRYSSGEHGDNGSVAGLWDTLQQGGADLVLSGHDHDYERFAPMDSAGRADPDGMRQFVVGTGGKGTRGFGSIPSTSEAHSSSAFGVLRLSLGVAGYTWEFVPAAGSTYTDTGSATCR
jgi:hypothetical protein